jgi:hypothetical protein
MKTLYQQISEKFLSRLTEAKEIDEKKIGQLRVLFTDGKRLKAEDLVNIFSGTNADQIK